MGVVSPLPLPPICFGTCRKDLLRVNAMDFSVHRPGRPGFTSSAFERLIPCGDLGVISRGVGTPGRGPLPGHACKLLLPYAFTATKEETDMFGTLNNAPTVTPGDLVDRILH